MGIKDKIPGLGGNEKEEKMYGPAGGEERQKRVPEEDKNESQDSSVPEEEPSIPEEHSGEESENEMVEKEKQKEMMRESDGSERNELKEESFSSNKETKQTPDTGRYHTDLISPTGIHPRRTYMRSGEDYVRTMFINGWPDEPRLGFLNKVLLGTYVPNDISVYIDPFDPEKIVHELEQEVAKAEARMGEASDSNRVVSRKKRQSYKETKGIFELIHDKNQELFDVGMYVTVRGEDKETLKENTNKMVRNLKTSPALTNPVTLSSRQMEGFQTVSPILEDKIGYRTEMMGGGIATMFPFTSKSIVERTGVDFGIHHGNNSPVIIDRWERDNGYNQFTVGKIGSGKSYSTKLNMLRSYINRDDLKIFMLDPVGGFDAINHILDGEKVMIGGKVGMNPMEIKETPDKVLERGEDIDPYNMKISNLMDFFEMYFNKRGVNLGEARGVLEKAIKETYSDFGINRQLATHSKESPTMADLVDKVQEIAENPSQYADTQNEKYINQIEDHATKILLDLVQFREGGEYENLAGKSDFDISGSDVMYFDLSQKEGSGDIGLMMHLLFGEIYQEAKLTNDKVMFIIDEAHYLMDDAGTLDFLETAVRHSRHLDLSINFITQTINEFFQQDQARAISEQCTIRLFHRVETELEEDTKSAMDLNDKQIQYIRSAHPGSEKRGYSEALLGVGQQGYIPIRVVSSQYEHQMLTLDDDDDEEEEEGVDDVVDISV